MYKENTKGYKIKTDRGLLDFAGIECLGPKKIWRIETTAGNWIECTADHKIYISDSQYKEAKDFLPGDTVITVNGKESVRLVAYTGRIENVYDIVEVSGIRRFYGNNILVSNCRFVIFEETLINSTKLASLEGKDPIRKDGQVRWYKEVSPDKMYAVGLDPAMGTGGDYAAIQVYELPTMIQVAEWQHNKSIVEEQIVTLQAILKYLEEKNVQEIFWSVENNSLGEAALVVIRSLGEDTFPGTMLNDPVRTNAGRNFRKGFTTTAKSKIEACSRLKSWIESGKMQVNSRNLISELKTFIAKSNSYEAKQGTTDDLVMATILIVRMVAVVANWEDSVAQKLNFSTEEGQLEYDDEEDYGAPLPVM